MTFVPSTFKEVDTMDCETVLQSTFTSVCGTQVFPDRGLMRGATCRELYIGHFYWVSTPELVVPAGKFSMLQTAMGSHNPAVDRISFDDIAQGLRGV